MRISDWSSDVCSSDLPASLPRNPGTARRGYLLRDIEPATGGEGDRRPVRPRRRDRRAEQFEQPAPCRGRRTARHLRASGAGRRRQDRKSGVLGKGGAVRLDFRGRRDLEKKKKK